MILLIRRGDAFDIRRPLAPPGLQTSGPRIAHGSYYNIANLTIQVIMWHLCSVT